MRMVNFQSMRFQMDDGMQDWYFEGAVFLVDRIAKQVANEDENGKDENCA